MELKCPKCGTMFTVDEADYASIASQVKNQEFDAEVKRREVEIRKQLLTEQNAQAAQLANDHQQAMSQKELELGKKDSMIAQLHQQLANITAIKDAEKNNAVLIEQQRVQKELTDKDSQITQLKAETANLRLEAQKDANAADKRLAEQKAEYETLLKRAEEEVEQYKDFKTKLGTKLLGESLEQHCLTSYDMYVRPYLTDAEFGKDNDCSEGTKGDFIFREKQGGVEVMSIMFEMKNEAEDSKTKHKNADFFKKLDEDRKKKNCEYAVLVSMLEKENELYNSGIVLATGYEKMYVIRPQFFLTMLAILRQTGQSTLAYKQQLEIANQQNVDVTNFEARMADFAKLFGKHCKDAFNQRQEAIKHLDSIIDACNKAKNALRLEGVHYAEAEKNIEDKFTIRALTAGNPTMKQKFDEAHENATTEVSQ